MQRAVLLPLLALLLGAGRLRRGRRADLRRRRGPARPLPSGWSSRSRRPAASRLPTSPPSSSTGREVTAATSGATARSSSSSRRAGARPARSSTPRSPRRWPSTRAWPLLAVVPGDDAEAAREYAAELEVDHPVAVADDQVWLDWAAREPPLVVLVAPGGTVLTRLARRRRARRSRRAARRPRRGAMRRPAAGLAGADRCWPGAAAPARTAIDVSLRAGRPRQQHPPRGRRVRGARPFEHVHAGRGYALEDAEGEVLAEGELPGRDRGERRSVDRLGRRADPDRLRHGAEPRGRARARGLPACSSTRGRRSSSTRRSSPTPSRSS